MDLAFGRQQAMPRPFLARACKAQAFLSMNALSAAAKIRCALAAGERRAVSNRSTPSLCTNL